MEVLLCFIMINGSFTSLYHNITENQAQENYVAAVPIY